VANRKMWANVEELVIVGRLAAGDLPSIDLAAPHQPPGLRKIVSRAVAVDPADRYPTAAELQADLERVLEGLDRPWARALGRFVWEMSAAKRAGIRARVEAQLRDVRWSGSSPAIRLPAPRADPAQVISPASRTFRVPYQPPRDSPDQSQTAPSVAK